MPCSFPSSHARPHTVLSWPVSLGDSWLWHFLFPCFWWYWQIWRLLCSYFVHCLSNGIWCFSHDASGVIGFGEEDHRGKVPFSSHSVRVYTINMIVNVDLDHLAEAVFVSFLHCKLIFLPSHTTPFEESHYFQLTHKEWKAMLLLFNFVFTKQKQNFHASKQIDMVAKNFFQS